MKYIKQFEKFYHPVTFDAKYYWRTLINGIKNHYKDYTISQNDESDNIITLSISNGDRQCNLKFDHTNCLLNGVKIDVHDRLFKQISNCIS